MSFNPLERLESYKSKGLTIDRKFVGNLLGSTTNQINTLKKEVKSAHTFNTPTREIPAKIQELGAARLFLKRMLNKMPKFILYIAAGAICIELAQITLKRIYSFKSHNNPKA